MAVVPTEPVSIVIFGGSGDLSKRKLVPALYELHLEGHLAPGTLIVGYARTGESDETYRAEMKTAEEGMTTGPALRAPAKAGVQRHQWVPAFAGIQIKECQ